MRAAHPQAHRGHHGQLPDNAADPARRLENIDAARRQDLSAEESPVRIKATQSHGRLNLHGQCEDKHDRQTMTTGPKRFRPGFPHRYSLVSILWIG